MKSVLVGALILFAGSFAFADKLFLSQFATETLMQNLKIDSRSQAEAVFESVQKTATSDRVLVRLTYPGMPSLRLFLSGPPGFLKKTDRSVPSLFMVAGFFTGAFNSLLLGEVPNTVVASLDYPYSQEQILKDPAKILQTFRLTPGAIALSLKWLSQQPWRNSESSLVMGVSLGGLFLPAGLHLAQEMNVKTESTVFAFTGADLKENLRNVLRDQIPRPLIDALAWMIPTLNTLTDPQLHLPYLQGRFLVIAAQDDQIIPASSTETLYRLLPPSKTSLLLPGGHINYDQKVQIERTKDVILQWMMTSR